MKTPRITRRKFLATTLLAGLASAADARYVEPAWLKVHPLNLARGEPTHRFVHFTDIHHKGDRAYFKAVVDCINSVAPDFVCFTGDLIEEEKYLDEALDFLSKIKAPMFGVPGNHDLLIEGRVKGESIDGTGALATHPDTKVVLRLSRHHKL